MCCCSPRGAGNVEAEKWVVEPLVRTAPPLPPPAAVAALPVIGKLSCVSASEGPERCLTDGTDCGHGDPCFTSSVLARKLKQRLSLAIPTGTAYLQLSLQHRSEW